ncbi:hypothetical protein AHAS_Ahas15G0074400 [Arachis hypogaea]
MDCFAKVSSQEEDLIERSTKKVKIRDKVDLNQPRESMGISDGVAATEHIVKKVTYKDSLLTISEPRLEGIPDIDLDDDMTEDDHNPEDRWNWVRNGTINVIDMDRDYYLIHFSDDEDYSHALMEGPWMIAGHYLVVQRWRPFFLTSEDIIRKIAVWIRIPNLSIELYNQRFMWRVGSAIGHMLKIDRTTSIHLRGKFARICVKIDLAKKLVPRISVLGSELNIEYEGLHQICFSCGKYGHRLDSYYENLRGQMPSQSANLGGGETTGEGATVDGEEDQKRNNNPGINAQEPNVKDSLDFGP